MKFEHAPTCQAGRGGCCTCGTDEYEELVSNVPWCSDLKLILDGTSCWPDLQTKPVIHTTHGLQVAGLPHGMKSGKPSVAIRLDLPDGRVVVAETSLALFLVAAKALTAKYGDPSNSTGD